MQKQNQLASKGTVRKAYVCILAQKVNILNGLFGVKTFIASVAFFLWTQLDHAIFPQYSIRVHWLEQHQKPDGNTRTVS